MNKIKLINFEKHILVEPEKAEVVELNIQMAEYADYGWERGLLELQTEIRKQLEKTVFKLDKEQPTLVNVFVDEDGSFLAGYIVGVIVNNLKIKRKDMKHTILGLETLPFKDKIVGNYYHIMDLINHEILINTIAIQVFYQKENSVDIMERLGVEDA